MGTRHLIAIFHNGKYKLAQYGQWDGYPDRQGVKVLKFLSDQDNMVRLIANLDKLFQPTPEQIQEFDTKVDDFQKEAQSRLRELRKVEDIDSDNEELVETGDQIRRPTSYLYPSLSRDTGADILEIIANSSKPVPTLDQLDFVFDSVYCEWVYVIDFDSGALEVYAPGHRTSAKTRFDELDFMKQNHDPAPYPVPPKASPVLVASFDLKELPSEQRFLKETTLDTEDDDDDCETGTTDSDQESL